MTEVGGEVEGEQKETKERKQNNVAVGMLVEGLQEANRQVRREDGRREACVGCGQSAEDACLRGRLWLVTVMMQRSFMEKRNMDLARKMDTTKKGADKEKTRSITENTELIAQCNELRKVRSGVPSRRGW